jgi:hypothetical protein
VRRTASAQPSLLMPSTFITTSLRTSSMAFTP